MDLHLPRSHFEDQAAYLADRLNMDHVFGTALRYGRGAYGNALLSRFPIESSVIHRLPSLAENRICLEAKVTIDGKTVTLLNTHLGLDRRERLRQLEEVIIPLLQKQNDPAILTGDLNAPDYSAQIEAAAGNWQDTFKNNTGPLVSTYPANAPQVRIDYIFINSLCQCPSFQIITSQASDHLPVAASIRI